MYHWRATIDEYPVLDLWPGGTPSYGNMTGFFCNNNWQHVRSGITQGGSQHRYHEGSYPRPHLLIVGCTWTQDWNGLFCQYKGPSANPLEMVGAVVGSLSRYHTHNGLGMQVMIGHSSVRNNYNPVGGVFSDMYENFQKNDVRSSHYR